MRRLALAALLLAACGSPASVTGPDEFAALASRPGALLLDVRTREGYAAGRIPGATLLPHTELAARAAGLPADKGAPVLVYCASGGRSAKAAKALAAMGYTSVHDLSGGIRRWQSEGRPVEK
jgi:rhodanese-related sulfurtransferase